VKGAEHATREADKQAKATARATASYCQSRPARASFGYRRVVWPVLTLGLTVSTLIIVLLATASLRAGPSRACAGSVRLQYEAGSPFAKCRRHHAEGSPDLHRTAALLMSTPAGPALNGKAYDGASQCLALQ
jgi:hypothetical protein